MDRPTLADVPELAELIDQLGETTTAQAAALGYDRATLRLWRDVGLPKPIRMLLDRPEIAAAIAAAAARRNKSVIPELTS